MEDIRTQLGQRIRAIRKTMGWLQEELGDKVDLHSIYIRQLERGERNVSLDNLQKIAAAFNLTLAELFEFPATRPSKKAAMESRLSMLIRRLDTSALGVVLECVESFHRWTKSDGRKSR